MILSSVYPPMLLPLSIQVTTTDYVCLKIAYLVYEGF